ncbi:hypothetical protein T492DRAFT_886658 [Pavlovales sp. CCMP2436]|nr:hypothetical protein T492DRAFT_886658 [Pavlovales sp. CCMP2436]
MRSVAVTPLASRAASIGTYYFVFKFEELGEICAADMVSAVMPAMRLGAIEPARTPARHSPLAMLALMLCAAGLGGPALAMTRQALVRSVAAGLSLRLVRRDAAQANWLSSEPLEAFRKLEQEAADAKYGELAPIDSGMGGGQRLVPIINLEVRLARFADAAKEPSRWAGLRVELLAPALGAKQLKRDFNPDPGIYSDNIYYTDEARANIYLLGGTTPETAQTEQYMLRNEVIGALQNAEKEVKYLLEQAALLQSTGEGDVDCTDLVEYFAVARGALSDYLRRAEQRDVAVGRRLVAEGA